MEIKKKLRKIAMLYLYDLYEEMTYDEENPMSFEDWVKYQEYEFNFENILDRSRLDMVLFVTQYGELEAKFLVNVAR